MEKIKWGIIGPGNIANNFADGLIGSYSGQLVSIASKREDRRKTFGDKYDIHPDFRFDSYEDIINSEHIDAIYISFLLFSVKFEYHRYSLKYHNLKNPSGIFGESP